MFMIKNNLFELMIHQEKLRKNNVKTINPWKRQNSTKSEWLDFMIRLNPNVLAAI